MSGSTRSDGYDQADRLITTTNGITPTSYAYDGDGLRQSKTISGATTAQTWDVAAGLPQLLQDGGARYVMGPNGLPLELVTAGGTVLYYYQDQLGSTRAIFTAAGSAAASYTYGPYGGLKAQTGTTSTPFGYAGQYTDAETGLLYLRARYYDPSTSQFLSRDPLVDLTGQPYAYTADNPLNASDPSGKDFCSPVPNDPCDQLFAAAVSGVGTAAQGVGRVVGTVAGTIVGNVGTTVGGLYALGGWAVRSSPLAAVNDPPMFAQQWQTNLTAANYVVSCPGAVANTIGDSLTARYANADPAVSVGNLTFDLGTIALGTLGTAGRVGAMADVAEIGTDLVTPRSATCLKGPIPDQSPGNLYEQLALSAAKNGAGNQIMGRMTDEPRLVANYGRGTWVKMEYVLRGFAGDDKEHPLAVVHYFRNISTGQDVDFKFK